MEPIPNTNIISQTFFGDGLQLAINEIVILKLPKNVLEANMQQKNNF